MEKNTKGIAVDIDEVLSQTALSWMDIVNKKFGNSENLSAAELLKKYKLTRNVPGWQNGIINDFLESMRVSNEFYENIAVIENSIEYLNKIDKIIPVHCYLTTRPQVIFEGTKKWLKDNGFPDRDVIMKPNEIPTKDGNAWKVGVLDSLYPDIVGIIDDNPEVIDLLPETYKGTVLLYGHKEYPF
ncbi:MAG: hypothetical protein NT094_01175, partial [Candidatus Staskawiczbacteria bacterium]|nr:hypothetical protein [Candidatus Staskawiczbacteria bacterium]